MPTARPVTGQSLADLFPDVAAEWHPTKNGTVEADEVKAFSQKKVWWRCRTYPEHEWQSTVGNRVQGRGCPICGGKQVFPGFNDLATIRPDIAAEWHPTKNGDLKPTGVTMGAGTKVWWKCPVGDDHEWETSVTMRTSPRHGRGCAVCAGRVVVSSNCLATLHPHIAAEWHPERNGDLTPKRVTPYVTRKVWWRCGSGHEWQATLASRTRGRTGCPQCAGKVPIPGETDLATLHPAIAAEWHPERNGELQPDEFRPGSNRPMWWQCNEGHEWRATIVNRANLRSGCPYCAGQRPISGVNDLATTHPEIAKSWHPTKNGSLEPSDVMAGTDRKLWWRCELGHAWAAPPYNRTSGIGCAICANKKVLAGFNDLATTDPALAREWHPTKNASPAATVVTAGSGKKCWWICDKGHEWRSTVANRSLGQGCPVCAPTGFNPAADGWLYLLFHPEWQMQQIGISNVIEDRLARHQQKGWELMDLRGPMPGDQTAALERAALRTLRAKGARLGKRNEAGNFDGFTESWTIGSFRVPDLRALIELVNDTDC